MKKHALILLSLGLSVTLLCCKTKKETNAVSAVPFSPGEAQVNAAGKRWPGTAATELQEGQQIFSTRCTQCHQAFDIPGFSEKKWLHEIDEMAPKAKLTEAEKLKLTKHILSFRDAALATKN